MQQIIQPDFVFLGQTRSRFQALLGSGIILGALATLVLAALTGLAWDVMLGLSVTVILASYALALAVKAVTGSENYTLYHYLVLILGTAVLFLAAVGRPILPYLDVLCAGLALTQTFGRLGCLMGGCCHGRPARWGVCYAPIYAKERGFPRHLVNTRLVPTQLIESGWALAVFTISAGLLIGHAAPGTVLVLYGAGYAALRFALEWLRGDPARRYVLALSEAQWSALAVLTAIAAAGWAGFLPLAAFSGTLAAAAWIAALIVLTRERQHMLDAPRHVRELLFAARRSAAAPELAPVSTSLGVRLTVQQSGAGTTHYALSRASRPLTADQAGALAQTLARLCHAGAPYRLVPGRFGVFHILVSTDIPLTDEREGSAHHV